MANEKVKISELPAATAMTSVDIFPIVQGGENKTATTEKIIAMATYNYVRTMTGDEEIPYVAPAVITVCSMDPNGADRILTPDADFPAGSILLIKNKGPYSITFNDGGSPAFEVTLGAGEKDFFIFDETNWG